MIGEFIDPQFINDTMSAISCWQIPKVNNQINISEFEKLSKIYKSDYAELAGIIFEKSIGDTSIDLPKNPYNEYGYAVLFFDASGQVFEYIQFCYNSKIAFSSFPESNLKSFDFNKFLLLKKVFKDNGLIITEFAPE